MHARLTNTIEQDGAEYNPWLAYSQSKTANVLFASALAERFKSRGVLAFSLNPGREPAFSLPEAHADRRTT